MKKLYYLGKAEYLKNDENFTSCYITEKNIKNIVESEDYTVFNEHIPHSTFMDAYFFDTSDGGSLLLNPLRTDKFYFFSLDEKTIKRILSQSSKEDAIGDLDLFLVIFKELNTLVKI